DPTTLLKDALAAAFNAFALPFSAGSASRLPDAAFVDYIFTGNVAFGAGLSYGVSLGAASLGQLQSSFSSVIAKGGIAPSIKAAASLAVNFTASDSYRLILGRELANGSDGVTLSISKVDKKAFGLDLGIEVSASLGAQFNLEDAVNAAIERAAAPVLAGL